MSNKSKGEEAFANAFTFIKQVPDSDEEEIRDYLYKFNHNLSEARDFLQIIKQVNDIDYSSKSELLFRIQGMALQCFPLAMRRMTDQSSRRSIRRFIRKVIKPDLVNDEVKKIKEIYSHYEFYLNKGVAHQDEQSISEALSAYPDSDIIDNDMRHLEDFYDKIVKEICNTYIRRSTKVIDYAPDLHLLIK